MIVTNGVKLIVLVCVVAFVVVTILNFAIAAKNRRPSRRHADEIRDLPGLNHVINFRQYSGYLNARAGHSLHYWFVESQRSPAQDPVLLWLTGGPGCSSLDALLSELGPFRVRSDGRTLYDHEYSWNKVANVLFLESPTSVGFSYSKHDNDTYDDDTVSEDNYLALQHFFRKFPQFSKSDFYICGQSYSGVSVPTLSVRVAFGHADIRLKGSVIGNGVLDEERLTQSKYFYGYYRGLIGNFLWENITRSCCVNKTLLDTCRFTRMCSKLLKKVEGALERKPLNMYNIHQHCLSDATHVSRYRLLRSKRRVRPSEVAPCIDRSNETIYLNQKTVQKALNVPDSLEKWRVCNGDLMQVYKNLYPSLREPMLKLLNSGKVRGLLYFGDLDIVCDHLAGEWFARSLGLPSEGELDVWYHDGQLAGFVKYYQNLTYTIVVGAGHMVPIDKPGPALKMLTDFLHGQHF